MRIGRLNSRITIEHPVITGIDESNSAVYSWQTLRMAWAEVFDVRSQEIWSEENKQRLSQTETRFRIHYSDGAGLDSSMRVRYQNALYDIKSIVVDRVRRQQVTIDAVAQNVSLDGALAVFCVPVLTATVGEIYQCAINVIGGTAPFSVSLTDIGSPGYEMPAGLSLAQAEERVWSLEGYPSQAGSYPISVIVEDANGATATVPEFTLVVTAE
jgi:SPP1 family predicted phage head-tail adaptor